MRSLTYQGFNVTKAVLCCSRDRGYCAKYISYLLKLQFPLNLGSESLPDLLQVDQNVRSQATQQHLCKGKQSTRVEMSQGFSASSFSVVFKVTLAYNCVDLKSDPS